MSTRSRVIATAGSNELVVKKSRFICSLARAASEDEAREIVAAAKTTYWDASHNCTAWVIGERAEHQRSNDDGEPSGTAGVPMLSVLNQRELTDTVAVVTRYFGGAKLGAAGLIRAYGQAVSDAIDAVGIVERKRLLVMAIDADHDIAGRVDNALRSSAYHLDDVEYAERVSFIVHIDPSDEGEFASWIAETTNGRCAVEQIGYEIVEIPVDR